MGLLSLLLWTPAGGVLALLLVSSRYPVLIRALAISVSLSTLFLSLWLLSIYDSHSADLQFNEFFPLNPVLGSAYALGVDGLSLPLLVLATLLTFVALINSFSITGSLKGYHICVLLLEFGILGVFLAQDWALFYIFWEVTLIPLFFLIDRWGGKRRHAASLNFVLYTMGGSVFMLISLLAISQYDLQQSGSLMSSMHQAAQGMPRYEQVLVLLGFLIGFGVKMPIFPLHGWLPLAHVEAPSPISILLSGVLLKMGAYGLIRVVVMLPEATQLLQPLLLGIALFGMLYGSLLAWRQSDLKAMVAYSSISHMGMVLLGIACLDQAGIEGALLQMLAHGLIAAALFLLAGLLYERIHSRSIMDYSALALSMPRMALCLVLALLALMGLPGTFAFVAELHILAEAFRQWGAWMLLFSLSVLITATYVFRTLSLLCSGTFKSATAQLPDLNGEEALAAGILLLSIVGFGFMPQTLLDLSASSLAQLGALIKLRVG